MSESDGNTQVVVQLHAQLQQSQQQEERLKDALTRVLRLVDDAKSTR